MPSGQQARRSAIADFGLYAVNSLRMEKAYRGWGAELTNEVTMIDADMARFIRFDKGDFVGRHATLDQQDRLRHSGECRNPVDKEATLQLVYFEVDAIDSDIRGSEPMFKGDDMRRSNDVRRLMAITFKKAWALVT